MTVASSKAGWLLISEAETRRVWSSQNVIGHRCQRRGFQPQVSTAYPGVGEWLQEAGKRATDGMCEISVNAADVCTLYEANGQMNQWFDRWEISASCGCHDMLVMYLII